ncbi:MAG: sulfatase-like hydrolase/transferase [Planctomycetes bacterium]|nr:sulfatase-like hydrolase/transferase [Planctomycetota bacterium]
MRQACSHALFFFAILFSACAQEEARPEPVRVRLFDLMDQVEQAQVLSEPLGEVESTDVWRYDFSESAPQQLWFGRLVGRQLEWGGEGASVDPSGGLEGGSLKLGPGVEEDRSVFAMMFPCEGRMRLVLSARVKLEGNPLSEDATTREALRIVEHRSSIEEPGQARRRPRSSARVSRRYDPSGWDRVEVELLTDAETETVEVQLLHRSGGSKEAVTRFDDVVVDLARLTEREVLERVVQQYKPNDGTAGRDPWRLRVSQRGEVRDAALLMCPGRMAFPLKVPSIEHAPQLRFGLTGLPEARRARGDGVVLSVSFDPADGESQALVELPFDPKNERDDREWGERVVSLGPVAGLEGELVFSLLDADDEPDEMDAVLLGDPRIEPTRGEVPGLNVLLIGVDTLRADHLSAFGYERETTPNLSALADEGVRFTMTRSQAPWTLPSFSSTLTSLYPSVHGAGRGGHDEWEPIDPNTVSLAEVLSRNGYETAGIVANGLISPRYGLDQGYAMYRAAWAMESVQRDTSQVIDFVQGHTRTPWHLFWHIMDPHLPYTTEASFKEEFTEEDYEGQFAGGRDGSVPFEVLDPRPGRRWYAHEGPPPPPNLSEADKRYVVDYYDAEIAEVDAAIGRVIEALRDSGQWERTVVAFVADHGEGLGDHDHYHHGYTLYDDQVHIPMILRIPGREVGRVIDRPVAAIDLAPTLLGALGISSPESFQGVDRLAPDAPSDDHYFIEYPTYDSSAQKGWVQGRFKYLHDPVFHTEHLFDTVADPGEQVNVLEDHPEVVARARAALDAFRWEKLQVGRFHLRVIGQAGDKLSLKVRTDDLFDANFITKPLLPEEHFEMNLERTELTLETELEVAGLEWVFWCRGNNLSFEGTLNGAPIELVDLAELPLTLERGEIREARAAELGWPEPGQALLWLEAGAGDVMPVVNTPEEIERLQQLGYVR